MLTCKLVPLSGSRVDHIRLSSMISETTAIGMSRAAQLRLVLTAPWAGQPQLKIRMKPSTIAVQHSRPTQLHGHAMLRLAIAAGNRKRCDVIQITFGPSRNRTGECVRDSDIAGATSR